MTLTAQFAPARRGLQGVLIAPADKSISHRSALFGAMSAGELQVENYLRAADTDATLDAVRALGADVRGDGSAVRIKGVGLNGAREPAGVIDVRNSGTLLRLLPGWLAGQEGRRFTLDGDESIRRRPIDRIAEPLRAMGAQLEAERLPPFTVVGAPLHGVEYALPVASAQVKSCVLFAGLLAGGETTVIEPEPSRDHTERMMLRAGVSVTRDGSRITVSPSSPAEMGRLVVPGDPSSAAFWVAAATLVPASHVIVEGVGANWTRNGFVNIARRMGADVVGEIESPGAPLRSEDPITTLEIRAASLHGTVVEPAEVPLAIDELPLVALLGCFAEGETVVRGAQELRVKETDRIATVVAGLRALGGQIEATADGFVVSGTGGLVGGAVSSHGDHRLAMLGAVAGIASKRGVEVDGMEAAHVSYPTFAADLARLAT
ncbi:MAG: 3-phosphoshikimate 1-carboxyvinyltransferase [Solirubrobacteraceae bacterium]|jgi:3-phosphoshikimate 1-carboxyvinyltransferase